MTKLVRIIESGLMLIGFIILSSCRAQVLWTQLSNIPFETVKYDGATHTMWVADLQNKAVYKLAAINNELDFENAERIESPSDTVITDVCVSNGAWILSFSFSTPYFSSSPPTLPSPPKTNTISKYTDNTKSWQTFGSFTQAANCKSLQNGDVVFWSRNEIMRFNSADIQPQYISTKWDISYITDDMEGNLLVSTVNGEIYKQTLRDWALVDTLPPHSYPRLFVDSNGNLWVTSGDTHIYRYSNFNSKLSKEELLASSLGWRRDFFQDKSGRLWLVTSKSLMILEEGIFKEVTLPPRTVVLYFGSFDVKTNTLYISTEDGVFSLDLNKYSTPF
jgi:hypothetical protein